MKHVFIAYKHHEDSVFAELLTHKLRDAGFEAWIDHGQLQAGEDWRREIDSAIKNSLALIVIMTPAAKASEYVTYEWAFALGGGIRVIPVLHRETELHPCLEGLQFLNFTHSEFFPWPSLIKTLNGLKEGVWLETGKVSLEDKEYEKALEAYEQAILLNRNNPATYTSKSIALFRLKRYDKALAANEQAIQRDPDSALAWSNKGRILNAINNADQALGCCDKAIRLEPNLGLAWLSKGNALKNLGRYEEALEAYKYAIGLRLDRPDNVIVYINKGWTLNQLGKHQEALEAFEEAIHLDPDNIFAWNNKGFILKKLGRHKEALKALEEANRLGTVQK